MNPLIQRALSLFNKARQKANWRKGKCAILCCDPALYDLDDVAFTSGYRMHSAGIRTVPLHAICGTLGRQHDFDQRFYPLSDRLQDRWVNIAVARLRDEPVGLVRLYRVNHCYYVEDGHHRISVAHALGEAAIEAEIILLDSLLSRAEKKYE